MPQELQAALAAEVSKRSALERQIRAMERTHAAELERAEQAKADAKAAALKEVQERAREARERRLLHEQVFTGDSPAAMHGVPPSPHACSCS